MTNVTMYDSIYVTSLPSGGDAYAGYVNGKWATWDALVTAKEKTGAKLLSIDVFGNATAHCLDVESGDATNADVLPWFKRMKAAGIPVPVIYTSAGNTQAVINILMLQGKYTRQEFLIWSAHYTGKEHICAPAVCGYAAADATQWTDAGPNGCDVSAAASYFFPWTLGTGTPTTPVVTAPKPSGPLPYPAPTGLQQDETQMPLSWKPVVVDGKLIMSYTVQVLQMNGVTQEQHVVTQPSITLTGLVPGWKYKALVWANGGSVAPPHSELDFTA